VVVAVSSEKPDVEEEGQDIIYECVVCGRRVSWKNLQFRGGRIRCPNEKCKSLVLRKVRPPVVKRIKCE